MTRRPYQTTKSGAVRCQIRDPLTGRRRSITAKTPAELAGRRATLDQLRRDCRSNLRSPQEVSRLAAGVIYGALTVADIWAAWVADRGAHFQKQAAAIWRHRFDPAFAGLKAWEPSESRMAEWQAKQIAAGLSWKTIANAVDCLAAAYRVAIRQGKIETLPWGHWRPRRGESAERPACTSFDDFVAMVAAAREIDSARWAAGRYADLSFRVLVFGLCGLRQGEGAGLGWDDVKIDGAGQDLSLIVRHQALDAWAQTHPEWHRPLDPPKGRRGSRTGPDAIQLHAAAAEALRNQRKQLQDRGWYRLDGPVFPAAGGDWRRHAETIPNAAVRKVAELAGLPNPEKWCCHSLRHTFVGFELVAYRGDVATVMARTRHRSIAVFSRYLHQMSLGLPESRIPAIASHLIPQHTETAAAPLALPAQAGRPEFAEGPIGAALADLAQSAGAARELAAAGRADAIAAQRRRHKLTSNARRAVPRVPFAELAAAAAAGPAGNRPPAVTRAVDEAYSRAYKAALRAGKAPADAQKAGKRARRATIASWARCLSQARGRAPAPAAADPAT